MPQKPISKLRIHRRRAQPVEEDIPVDEFSQMPLLLPESEENPQISELM